MSASTPEAAAIADMGLKLALEKAQADLERIRKAATTYGPVSGGPVSAHGDSVPDFIEASFVGIRRECAAAIARAETERERQDELLERLREQAAQLETARRALELARAEHLRNGTFSADASEAIAAALAKLGVKP